MNPYLEKYSYLPPLIGEKPRQDLGIIVVVPSYCEPHLISFLRHLQMCNQPDCGVEVLVVMSVSETDEAALEENLKIKEDILQWKEENTLWYDLYLIACHGIPQRHAGLGLSRKIGMDEAVRRYEEIGDHNRIITSMDADSSCANNYFTSLEDHFSQNKNSPACTIYFEYEEFSQSRIEDVAYQYELHLRYLVLGLKFAGHPYYFQSNGSALAFRSAAYQKIGGMNRKPMKESVFFTSKLLDLGGITRLNTTRVLLNPRPEIRPGSISGKLIKETLYSSGGGIYTYHPQVFKYLRSFFQTLPEFYFSGLKLHQLDGILPVVLVDFLSVYFFDERIQEIKQNSRNINSFYRRFFSWFNYLMVRRCMDFISANAHPNVKVQRAAMDLVKLFGWEEAFKINPRQDLLVFLRQRERLL